MSTLNSGSSATVSLDAFSSISVTSAGSGAMTITSLAPSLFSNKSITRLQNKIYGPYGVPTIVVLTAVDRPLVYTVNGISQFQATVPVVLYGDSKILNTGGPGVSGEERRFANYGQFTWVNARCRGAMRVIANLGISGVTLATLASDYNIARVIATGAKLCLFQVTGNGIANTAGITFTDLTTNLTKILLAFRNAGIYTVLGTVHPRALSGAGGFDTQAKRDLLVKFNQWIYATFSEESAWCSVADMHGAVTEYSDGSPLAGAFRDTPAVHNAPYGAQLDADALVPIFKQRLRTDYKMVPLGNTYNILTTAMSSWTTSQVSGTVNATWDTAATGSDGLANWVQLTADTFSAGGALARLTHPSLNTGTGFSVGDILEPVIEIEIDSATDIRTINFIQQLNGASPAGNLETMAGFSAAQGITVNASTKANYQRMIFRSPRYAVTGSTTSCSPRIDVVAQTTSAAIVVRYRYAAVMNLTTMGLV